MNGYNKEMKSLWFADFNGNIWQLDITNFVVCCNLHKCILSQHPTLPPATFKWGDQYGSSPLMVFGPHPGSTYNRPSSMLCTVQHSHGDHRAMVVNLHLLDTNGEPQFTIVHPLYVDWIATSPLPLNSTSWHFPNSVSTTNWIENLITFSIWHNNPPYLFLIWRWNGEVWPYQWLAEKKCHHLCMGVVQFSPDLNYWHNQQEL